MRFEIVTVPCLKDNYAFLLHDNTSGETAVFDVPEAGPIAAALTARGWTLTDIVLTHHHADHIQGVSHLPGNSRVIGAEADAHRLPGLDIGVKGGDRLWICGTDVRVIDVPGHTVGHVAYHVPEAGAVFTGDSLMALGCGRLFEGSAEQMWASLSVLAALPPETLVCSGHEYTAANARFALELDPDNAALHDRARAVATARAEGKPTVPSRLADELSTNPFLRAGDARLKSHLGMAGASDAAVFAEVRARKDVF